MNKPSRFEGDIFDLEFTGTIPKDINGTFFRIAHPDARFPPVYEDDIHFNGDSAVTAIRIQNGHADFKAALRADGPLQGRDGGAGGRCSADTEIRSQTTRASRASSGLHSNTNVTFWRGMLLASKRRTAPVAMDPETLETIGRYDFEGQIPWHQPSPPTPSSTLRRARCSASRTRPAATGPTARWTW